VQPAMRRALPRVAPAAEVPERPELVGAGLERGRRVAVELVELAELPEVDLAVVAAPDAAAERPEEALDLLRDLDRPVVRADEAPVREGLGALHVDEAFPGQAERVRRRAQVPDHDARANPRGERGQAALLLEGGLRAADDLRGRALVPAEAPAVLLEAAR